MEKWTKRCKCGHSFIADDWELCDLCLLSKYGLLIKSYEPATDEGYFWGESVIPEKDVVKALRKAEKESTE